MVFQAALGSVANSYLRGAMAGWSGIAAAGRMNNTDIGDFNMLKLLGDSTDPARLEIKDLQNLEATLKEVAPELFRKYRRDIKKLGTPALREMQSTFRNITMFGPLGPVRRPNRRFDKMATSPVARLSWYNSRTIAQNRAIDVNYKNRNATKDFAKLRTGRDGTLSILRLRIHAPAYIIADIAGASGKARSANGKYTRYYDKTAGNGQVITTRHRVSYENVTKWLRALDNRADNKKQNNPSRYAWPTMEEYMPKHRANTSKLLNDTIAELNRRMAA